MKRSICLATISETEEIKIKIDHDFILKLSQVEFDLINIII